MNKKRALLMGLLVVFFAVFFVHIKNDIPPTKKVDISAVHVTQTVILDSKKTTTSSSLKTGTTALELLNRTNPITTKGQKENAFVTMIEGRAANSEKEFWSFYVNGKQAETGAGSYILKNNDTIEWKIEAYK